MISGSNSLDYNDVLSRFAEEDIFSLGGIEYTEKALHNPFRNDTRAKCRFSEFNDTLYFCDGTRFFFGKNCITAFELIQYVYKTAPGHETCKFIIDNCKANTKRPLTKRRKPINTIIRIDIKPWQKNSYLVKHGFSPEILKSENIYLVSNYYCNDRINPHIIKKNPYGNPRYIETISYVFPSGNIKLYWPGKKGEKFFTNCRNSDIWGDHFVGDVLNVTKSGKDYLFLKHMVKLPHVIATQSENVTINSPGYDVIRYFYDSDPAGIKISTKLKNEGNDTRCLLLAKDPFELLEQRGKEFAINHIKCLIS